jgi:hypothetical protein
MGLFRRPTRSEEFGLGHIDKVLGRLSQDAQSFHLFFCVPGGADFISFVENVIPLHDLAHQERRSHSVLPHKTLVMVTLSTFYQTIALLIFRCVSL